MKPLKPVLLLLVRHGQAQSNVLRILASYPEVRPLPLSESGRRAVKKSARALVGKNVTVIFASPLTRTQETATLLNEQLNVPIITDGRLRETDFGIYNNQSTTRFFLRYPYPGLRRVTSPKSGVEGLDAVQVRLKEFLREIRISYAGQTVVVVTHSDVIHELLGILTGTGRSLPPVKKAGIYPGLLQDTTPLD